VVKPAFRGGAVHVRVPATCANLGPGFDALGLALGWYDDVVARAADEGLVIDVAGEGEDLPRDEKHLVVRAMRATFDKLGGQPHGLELSCANRIPHGRGLGSSAAAIVAGVTLARALVVGGDERLSTADVLALASQLEGHPDNVAACVLGGLTIAWTEPSAAAGQVAAHAVRLDCDPSIRPVVFVAPSTSSTRRARRLLPETVPHADAAFNAARAALLVAALTGDPQALFAATEDRLHQPYRAPAMPKSADLVARLRSKGLPAVVSGAGPTVLVLARDEAEVEAALAAAPTRWQATEVPVDLAGAQLVPR
jgi:homoserine kinase